MHCWLLFGLWLNVVDSFFPVQQAGRMPVQRRLRDERPHSGAVVLRGWGYVEGLYNWTENDFEVEVSLPIPSFTSTKDIDFSLRPRHLKLQVAGEAEPRMDGQLRGKVTTDGSYWSIESGLAGGKMLSIRLEKKLGTRFDPEQWMGVLLHECEAEAEIFYQDEVNKDNEFNVEEYVDYLGGYDENLVDKSMFSLSNMTGDLVKELMESGLVQDNSGMPDWTEDEALHPQSPGTLIQDATIIDSQVPVEKSQQDETIGEFDTMKVHELKESLRKRGLPVSGRKAELVSRLKESRASTDGTGAAPRIRFE